MTKNREQLVDELNEWARGSLPLMAAVDFVVATGTELAPMVGYDHGRVYLDVFVDDERAPDYLTTEQWLDRVGTMSGGQRATWELARSIADGELDRWFWRLDTHRKLAFASALLSTALVVGPNGEAVAAVEP
jgi:hypothetical protein